MWLMYPVLGGDVRRARAGVGVLIGASLVWYVALTGVVAVWPDAVLSKVRNKFAEVPGAATNWTPFLILLVAFSLAGCLRALGYRLSRNVTGALAVPESTDLGTLGVFLWLAACGTIYVGFSGLIGLVAALAGLLELRFQRYPAALFQLTVGPQAVRLVGWYVRLRTLWLGVVIAASLVILVAHGVIDIPRAAGGPNEATILRVTSTLKVAFNALASAALITLPLLTVAYFYLLGRTYNALPRLTDPNGAVPQAEPPPKPGFDQLKEALRPQAW